MVEVFKTNVNECSIAEKILFRIRKVFPDYDPNFDLEDSDRILRIESKGGIEEIAIINIVTGLGFRAEILPEDIISN